MGGGEGEINFRQLSYFCKVVDVGNITAAAEMFNLAQPALGYQIRQLEVELGVNLIIRHSRGVTPTPAGRLLYSHGKRILGDIDQAVKEVQAYDGVGQEQLRLGVCPSIVLVLGPDRLIDTRATIPDVTVSLLEESTAIQLDALNQGQIDIAFLYNIDDQPGLERRTLLEEYMLFVTAPELTGSEASISFSEALVHDLVMGGDRSIQRHLIEAEARRLSLKPRITYQVNSIMSVKTMVMRGAVASIMPYAAVHREIREGTLAGRRIVSPELTRTLYVARQSQHIPLLDNPYVIVHIENLIEAYMDMMGSWARRLA